MERTAMTSFYDTDSYEMLRHAVVRANFLFGDIPVRSGAVTATQCGTQKMFAMFYVMQFCSSGVFFGHVSSCS